MPDYCPSLYEAIMKITGDEAFASIAVQLRGKRCSEVRAALEKPFVRVMLKWVYEPRGWSPSDYFDAIVLAICKQEPSLIDKLLQVAERVARLRAAKK